MSLQSLNQSVFRKKKNRHPSSWWECWLKINYINCAYKCFIFLLLYVSIRIAEILQSKRFSHKNCFLLRKITNLFKYITWKIHPIYFNMKVYFIFNVNKHFSACRRRKKKGTTLEEENFCYIILCHMGMCLLRGGNHTNFPKRSTLLKKIAAGVSLSVNFQQISYKNYFTLSSWILQCLDLQIKNLVKTRRRRDGT